jgi:hypothetical protein
MLILQDFQQREFQKLFVPHVLLFLFFHFIQEYFMLMQDFFGKVRGHLVCTNAREQKFPLCVLWVAAVVFLCSSLHGLAQDNKGAGRDFNDMAKNTFFAELGGSGLIYSFNYDRLLAPSWSVRGGLSFIGFAAGNSSGSAGVGLVTIPLTTSYLFNLGGSASNIELGGGITPLIGSVSGTALGSTGAASGVATMLTGIVGYRLQPFDGGFNFRANVTPLFFLGSTTLFITSFGISAGYTFN